jgi:hypothetical protein
LPAARLAQNAFHLRGNGNNFFEAALSTREIIKIIFIKKKPGKTPYLLS